MNDREKYVTNMIATWLVSEGEYITIEDRQVRIAEHAAELAKSDDMEALRRFVEPIIKSGGSWGPMALAGEVRQEMAYNDYNRVDWMEVANALRATF
ncbi:hypothetical protein [Nocardia sp. NPDC057440]|uniref:hypothetical protein n=1 Tax=Nocardia sp. NPDC057440 TaxID=3346134 RepID=UPI0036711212